MPPQLEANKKQHLENWEHAPDSYLALIIRVVSIFGLNKCVQTDRKDKLNHRKLLKERHLWLT